MDSMAIQQVRQLYKVERLSLGRLPRSSKSPGKASAGSSKQSPGRNLPERFSVNLMNN